MKQGCPRGDCSSELQRGVKEKPTWVLEFIERLGSCGRHEKGGGGPGGVSLDKMGPWSYTASYMESCMGTDVLQWCMPLVRNAFMQTCMLGH